MAVKRHDFSIFIIQFFVIVVNYLNIINILYFMQIIFIYVINFLIRNKQIFGLYYQSFVQIGIGVKCKTPFIVLPTVIATTSL